MQDGLKFAKIGKSYKIKKEWKDEFQESSIGNNETAKKAASVVRAMLKKPIRRWLS